MARVRAQQPVLPSLLDRLLDDAPEDRHEPPKATTQLLADFKGGVRRDLENLLNTRLYRQQAIEPYSELARSVVNYGLPDFSTVLMGSAEHREEFRRIIQDTITRFEPRLKRVRVDVTQNEEDRDRTLYLRITALLLVEPDPVPLLFDSRLRALDRVVKLRELRHG